ncbi:MAG TPA: serine/threonine-protein kinase [Gemmataceae bacterium]|jgi:serine/threonine protein kinase|nr:serine/threonine-protein kinase [Gemmataceae bacterium]
MPLEPGRYVHMPLAELVRDLESADPRDVPLPNSRNIELHGPGLRAEDKTESLAYRGDNVTTLVNDTRLPDAHPDIEIPGVVLEHFLGGGAQGWVYAGRVRTTNKIVAVKILARGRDENLAWGAREALLCARVRHRNVLRVLRAQPVGEFWVVLMELVQGEELRRGTLSGTEARVCFGALADALLALARSRLVHRDIKPANVILRRPDRSPVLIDFGLAVDLAEQGRNPAELSGTPFYMAPEAWRDAPPDPAWDAYALGVTAAVVLVGPPAMGRDLPTLRRAKLSGDFERLIRDGLDQVGDAEMRQWVNRLIAPEPKERQNALDIARAWVAA